MEPPREIWVSHSPPAGSAIAPSGKSYDPQYSPALVQAAQRGDLQRAQYLLEQGADPNACVEYQGPISCDVFDFYSGGIMNTWVGGGTATWSLRALTAAAEDGNVTLVRLLLEQGADPNGWEAEPRTPLMAAAGMRNEETQPDYRADQTPRKMAASSDYCAVAALLLEHGAPVDAGCSYGQPLLHMYGPASGATPLMYAAREGRGELVRLLLERGANPNTVAGDWQTPLIYADVGGHPDLVRLLLERVTDLDVALFHSAYSGRANLVRLLLERGVDVNWRNSDGWNALDMAGHGKYWDIVRLLLTHGAVPTENMSWQPAANRQWDIVRMLVDSGADPNLFLHDTIIQDSPETMRMLLERGADPNARFRHETIFENYRERYCTVVDSRDDPHPGDGFRSFLHLAEGWQRYEIVEMLLQAGAKR
jgi:ankyrin repeat protein